MLDDGTKSRVHKALHIRRPPICEQHTQEPNICRVCDDPPTSEREHCLQPFACCNEGARHQFRGPAGTARCCSTHHITVTASCWTNGRHASIGSVPGSMATINRHGRPRVRPWRRPATEPPRPPSEGQPARLQWRSPHGTAGDPDGGDRLVAVRSPG